MDKAKRYGAGILLFLLILTPTSANTFFYNEGDLVRIILDVEDADDDRIDITYSEPLDKNGEWQTGYNDAGNYTATLTVSDGEDIVKNDVLLVIKDVNRAPVLTVKDITVFETEAAKLEIDASDPDDDELFLTYPPFFNEDGIWQTDYNSAGIYTFNVIASDGRLNTSTAITVKVIDKNQPPSVSIEGEQEINEGSTYTYTASSSDAENNPVTFAWYLDGDKVSTSNSLNYTPDYDSAGNHYLKLEANDGYNTVEKELEINVKDTNRAPEIEAEDITVKEGENITLSLPEKDADGDELSYLISPKFEGNVWQTNYWDAGEHMITITASDGITSQSKTIKVTVLDVDRTPVLGEIGNFVIYENETLAIQMDAYDPDEDSITFSSNEGMFRNNTFTWVPGYDFAPKPGFYQYMLKSYPEKSITIKACSKGLCDNQTFSVKVKHANRPPVIIADDITIGEGDTFALLPNIIDHDGDKVKVYFSKPLDSKGRWNPELDEAGEYNVTITATDGTAKVHKTIRLSVLDKNQPPFFLKLKDKKVKENEELTFPVRVSDPDNSRLMLVAEDLPPGAIFNKGVFSWTPDHSFVESEEKILPLTFAVNDGNITVKKTIAITVEDANQLPVINFTQPSLQKISIRRGESIVFAADASDADNDLLSYNWNFGWFDNIEGVKAVKRRFTSAGTKIIGLTISDGKDKVEYRWEVSVIQ